ncbi:hypothetical protein U1Q18_036274 [Sarracenia purpurea var. burkii]
MAKQAQNRGSNHLPMAAANWKKLGLKEAMASPCLTTPNGLERSLDCSSKIYLKRGSQRRYETPLLCNTALRLQHSINTTDLSLAINNAGSLGMDDMKAYSRKSGTAPKYNTERNQ